MCSSNQSIWQEIYYSPNIQTGSAVHPASYLMGTRGALSCGQSGWGVKLIILHLVLRLWIDGAAPTPHVCPPRCELYLHLLHLQYLCTKHVNTSSNDSDMYSGKIWTKISMVFLSPSRQMLKSHCNCFLPHPSKVIFHNHAVVWCYVDWLTDRQHFWNANDKNIAYKPKHSDRLCDCRWINVWLDKLWTIIHGHFTWKTKRKSLKTEAVQLEGMTINLKRGIYLHTFSNGQACLFSSSYSRKSWLILATLFWNDTKLLFQPSFKGAQS